KFGINAKCKPGNASASLRAWIADDSASSLIRFSYNVLLKQGPKCLSSVEDKSIDYAQIFPNPCSDYIDLKNFSSYLHQAVAKIFDVSGKLVLLQNIGSNLRIDTRSLEVGYYILQIQQENNLTLQKRFIKK
ncbi:MAG: T9SS type A sorting domain-containing protein, partial [Chitinophagales bacterium]|nr:T9SS type A sorting domain-containing protein [Chitinophagales bacterium]